MKRLRLISLLLVVLLLLAIPLPALADAHINFACTIEIHAENVRRESLWDNTYSTTVHFVEGDWFSVRWDPEKAPVAAVYWEWRYIPTRAKMAFLDENGAVLEEREYGNVIRFITVFPPEEAREVRMTVLEGEGDMAELFAYKQRQIELQPKLVSWEEPLDKADLMLVEAHGNDDVLIFGAVIPTCVERGYSVTVADICCDTIGRQRKSSGGSYHLGLRNFKTFFEFTDFLSYEYDKHKAEWFKEGQPDPVELLTAELRRVRPEVVVTHDPSIGDFHSGVNKLVAEITQEAVIAAADPTRYPDSAEKYGAWQVKKLYCHMYPENPIFIDVDTPLESFGGKTARQLAVEGMKMWNVEERSKINNIHKGKYMPSDYGLVFSTVGEDVEKNDFMENIPAECLTGYASSETSTADPGAGQ